MQIPWSITQAEKDTARRTMELILGMGASGVRIALAKSLMDRYKMRDGVLDMVTHAGDCDMAVEVFTDGRYGTFGINSFDEESIREISKMAIQSIRMLAEDPCRKLPERSLVIDNNEVKTGLEAGLFDPTYSSLTQEERLALAKRTSLPDGTDLRGNTLISFESSYSDSIASTYLIDSEGLEAMQMDSSFCCDGMCTLQDKQGQRYSDGWNEYELFLKDLPIEECAKKSFERTVAKVGTKDIPSGKYTMVLDNTCSSAMLFPVLKALNGYSIQQNASFLLDALGKKVFPESVNVLEEPAAKGKIGCMLFTTEGVRTVNRPIIENGVVREYYVDTYIKEKTGLPQSSPSIRPVLKPYGGATDQTDILKKCGRGILVTDFNGGNSNIVTGDFSFGVEGFLFEDGQIVHPVSGILTTGNFTDLWSRFALAGTDAILSKGAEIPTIAFTDVDFNA